MPKAVNLERIKTTRTIFVSGIVILLSLLLFSVSAPVVNANVIFSDSFSGGFSSTWFVPSGAVAPVVSLHGITAAGTNPWSVIDHTLSGNSIYDIQLDLWVNTNNIVSAWGTGINDGKGQWKNVGNWGPNNLLQIHDSSGSDILVPWNHEIGKHHFEVIVSPLGNTQFMVIEDGNKLTSITSGANFDITSVEVGLLGYLDYEMANFVLSTVDSTPTPTPTPIPTTKVVVIPGFGASWNAASLLSCGLINSGEWTLNPLAADIYNPIINAITNARYTPLPYYYDWRKDIRLNNQKLIDFITTNATISGERFHLVGHSLGGLVGRAYLESSRSSNLLDRMMTVGSPHQGTALAYYLWAGGEVPKDDLLWRFAATFILKECGGLGSNDRQTIQSLVPSLRNLLSTVDYLINHKSGLFTPVGSMSPNNQNNWLPSTNFVPNFFGVTVGSLSGNGFKTVKNLVVKDPTKHDEVLGNWIDGNPIKQEEDLAGDGTILASSSTIPGATLNQSINQDHVGLIASSQGIGEIFTFLGIPAPALQPLSLISPTSALTIIGYPASFWIVDPQGKIIKDTNGLVGIVNPKSGNYKLRFLPKANDTTLIVGQFLESGMTLWKKYKLTNFLPKFKSILFDPENPLEDALR